MSSKFYQHIRVKRNPLKTKQKSEHTTAYNITLTGNGKQNHLPAILIR